MKKLLKKTISMICIAAALASMLGVPSLAGADNAELPAVAAVEESAGLDAAAAEEAVVVSAEEEEEEAADSGAAAEEEISAGQSAGEEPESASSDTEAPPASAEESSDAGETMPEESVEVPAVDGASSYTWDKDGNTWYLFKKDQKVTGFATVKGKIYYLDPDADGNASAGWKKIDGTWYYFDKSTRAAVKGLKYLDSYYYFFNEDDGALRQEERLITASDGSVYYVDKYCHAQSGWKKVDGKWYYFGASSYKALTGLWTIGSNKYYFDNNGVMQTGLIRVTDERAGVEDKLYYFGSSGAAKSGWYQPSEGVWYYFGSTTKQALTGFWTISSIGRYFGPDGILVSGNGEYTAEDGKIYYLSNFIAKTGWIKREDGSYAYYHPSKGERVDDGLVTVNGNKYYFVDGAMQTGLIWVTDEKAGVDHELYYFTSSGAAKSGWYQPSEGVWYYFGATTKKALTGFWTISSIGRYFGPDGILVSGNGEYTAEDGEVYYLSKFIAVTGWVKNKDGQWTYFSTSDGTRYENKLLSVSNKKYYFNGDGTLYLGGGFMTIDGVTYYFSTTGAAQSGWVDADGDRYYFAKSTYEMLTGWQVANGKLYYFYTDSDDGKTGTMAHDTTIDGYELGSDGAANISVKDAMIMSAQSYSSKTKYLLMVDTTNCRLGVFTGSQGKWELKYYMLCTTGKDGHETPTGIYETYSRYASFGSDYYTCYYGTAWAHIDHSVYLFHSLLYYPGTYTLKSHILGGHVSNGCVRLAYDNAKWIYQNIPLGTKVISY